MVLGDQGTESLASLTVPPGPRGYNHLSRLLAHWLSFLSKIDSFALFTGFIVKDKQVLKACEMFWTSVPFLCYYHTGISEVQILALINRALII